MRQASESRMHEELQEYCLLLLILIIVLIVLLDVASVPLTSLGAGSRRLLRLAATTPQRLRAVEGS